MQKLQIIGYIGKDAEVKDISNNQIINFSVAVSESYKKDGETITNTTWYECSKFGNNVAVAQFLKKGTQVYVEGKPANRYFKKDDGSITLINGINVSSIELLSKPV